MQRSLKINKYNYALWKAVRNTSEEHYTENQLHCTSFCVFRGLRLQSHRWSEFKQDYCEAKWVKLEIWLPPPLANNFITYEMILIVWAPYTDEDQISHKNGLP